VGRHGAARSRSRANSRLRPSEPAFGSKEDRTASGTAPPATSIAETVEPQALVVTHSFDSDAAEANGPYSATLRLTGRRIGVEGRPQPGDAFIREEQVEKVVPGSGPVSVTSWVYGLRPGDWSVSGEVIRSGDGLNRRRAGRTRTEPAHRARWSWMRWAISDVPEEPVRTRWALAAPLARIPAVIPGSYPALFALGVVVAFLTQATLLTSEQIALPKSLLVSLLALVGGLLGAKLWSVALHPGESVLKSGWAVDGFLVVSPSVAFAGLIAFSLPIGPYLDASTPGLFFAVAIGRIGCFLTGCCAGRCTSSPYGVWSSDRRIGARRIPTQLLESAAGLLIGLASLPIVLQHARAIHGAVFVFAFVVYLVVRQLLLRLRAESRRYSWQRSVREQARP
jgi:phosphatidylglycerol:prolipoprotein diacylglycerol transferase